MLLGTTCGGGSRLLASTVASTLRLFGSASSHSGVGGRGGGGGGGGGAAVAGVERLAKLISRAGVVPSRRVAEDLMLRGKILVNKRRVPPSYHATRADRVSLAGVGAVPASVLFPPSAPKTRLWVADKLPGELVTRDDPQGRATLDRRLAAMGLPQPLVTVGRLDYNSEGIILLTNCGQLARELELPRNELERQYHVLVHGPLTPKTLRALRRGVDIEGEKFRPMEVAVLDNPSDRKWWLHVTLREGRYREIRRALAAFGLVVNKLVRQSYGPYSRNKHKGSAQAVELKGKVKALAKQAAAKAAAQQQQQAGAPWTAATAEAADAEQDQRERTLRQRQQQLAALKKQLPRQARRRAADGRDERDRGEDKDEDEGSRSHSNLVTPHREQ